MEIKITTQQVLKILLVIAWIVFVGLCINVGGVLFNAFYTLFINPIAAKDFWENIDMSAVLDWDKGYFMVEVVFMSIVAILKALLFYLIVRILHNKKLNLAEPFSTEMKRFVSNMSYLALGIGLFSFCAVKTTEWIAEKGIAMPDVQSMQIGGADVWLFMGIILIVIAQIFKRGAEIQAENEFTI